MAVWAQVITMIIILGAFFSVTGATTWYVIQNGKKKRAERKKIEREKEK